MTRRAAPACRAMTPMLWATVSCSSREMRSRSSVTAWAVAVATSVSACSRAWRTEWPTSQAMTAVMATAGSAEVPTIQPNSSRVVVR
ncbi:hypothetical protein ABZ260_44350 [Streptosporangium sp. NPDC006013]|uniref:hypothetical protein n=1 Tax=Streptosporangium sp. NPDC006013 TaxID=3155596 RepID=UPI0033A5F28A